MCCDGSLFDNVRLGPDENAQQLKALGLPVFVSRSKEPVALFRQPCAALCDDRTCRLYADRPLQCRAFECGVFKEVQAARINFAAALRLIRRARKKADNVRRLLLELGDRDESRSLGERFRRVKRRMESGNVDAAVAITFAELSMAVHTLNLLAHERFYTRSVPE